MERIVGRVRLFSLALYSGVAVFTGLAYLLVHHLASITGGNYAPNEVQSLAGHPSWHSIWNNPLSAPYFALLRLVHYGSTTPFYNRLAGATLGIVAISFIYFVLLRWVGWRVATLGTILFGTSGALLHTARTVSPSIMQLLTVAFLLAWYAWSHKQPKPRHLLIGTLAAYVLTYTPGVVLLVILAGVLNRQSLRLSWLQANKWQRMLVVAGGVILLAPLGYHLATHGLHDLLLWLGYGLPVAVSGVMDFVRGLWQTPLHLFVRSGSDGTFGMAHQAIINAPVGFLALLGTYVAVSRFHEGRWRFLILLLVSCWLLAALDGIAERAIAPLVYILAVVGIAYLLSDWYRVFPRNPIARSAGLLLIVAVVAISSWYELRSYFVAWPHNSATRATFVCPPTTLPTPSCNLVQ